MCGSNVGRFKCIFIINYLAHIKGIKAGALKNITLFFPCAPGFIAQTL
jgi:hypothetical protein